jgi:hypothetical protein
MEFLERNWYVIFPAVLGVLAIWLVLRRPKDDPGKPRTASLLIFGPFGPTVDRYLAKRGGFTKREWIGWGIVLLIAVLAIVFAPHGRGT